MFLALFKIYVWKPKFNLTYLWNTNSVSTNIQKHKWGDNSKYNTCYKILILSRWYHWLQLYIIYGLIEINPLKPKLIQIILIPFIPCSVYKSNCSRFSNYFYSLVLRTNSYAFRLPKRHLQWVQIYTITYASLVHNKHHSFVYKSALKGKLHKINYD
jgi:hypothetical protein